MKTQIKTEAEAKRGDLILVDGQLVATRAPYLASLILDEEIIIQTRTRIVGWQTETTTEQVSQKVSFGILIPGKKQTIDKFDMLRLPFQVLVR